MNLTHHTNHQDTNRGYVSTAGRNVRLWKKENARKYSLARLYVNVITAIESNCAKSQEMARKSVSTAKSTTLEQCNTSRNWKYSGKKWTHKKI